VLEENGLDPRTARHVVATADAIEAAGAPVHRVDAPGATPFERVMALVMLGDLVSVYLAILDGTDPASVEPIERLKARLGSS
jgi:glucose/mannose-6-phosphate isomerase